MSRLSANLLSKIEALPKAPCYWVAYSGGLDSHVLLHTMAQIRERLRGSLRAIHVHHGLQSEADQWLQHAIDESQRLDIELTALKLDLQPAKGESLEAVARDARYQAMGALLGRGDMLLTAQHQNDQAETLLLQLMRGSGPSGLAAMPELVALGEAWLVRPLLDITRAELLNYAQQHKLSWVEDGSNADLRFDRNYIRHQLMPLIERRWPAANSTIARSARHCAEAQQLIDHLAAGDFLQVRVRGNNRLSVTALRQLPVPRCRAVLRHWITMQGFQSPSAVQLERIVTEVLDAAEDRLPLVAWDGAEVRRFRDQLFLMVPLLPHEPSTILAWDDGPLLSLPSGLGLLHVRIGSEALDVWSQGRVEVRFRRGGERCQRQGEAVSRPLKKVFQESLKIPPWLRDRVPLIYINDELAAVADFFLCAGFVSSALYFRWEVGASIAGQLPKCQNL